MSVSLSQMVSESFCGIKRWLLGFFMTDEIFAVASAQNSVEPRFFAGLTVAPYLGWSLGTLAGSLLGNVLPESLMNALCLAIYGMFIAIIAPVVKASLKSASSMVSSISCAAAILLRACSAFSMDCAFIGLPSTVTMILSLL